MRKIAAFLMIGTLLIAGLTSISAVAKEPKLIDEDGLEASPFVTCFAYGTKITMADRSYKNIEDVKAGDKLMSYNANKGEFTSWTVNSVAHPNRPVYTISFDNGESLRVTEDHPIWIKKANGKAGWGSIIPMPTHVRLRGKEISKIEAGDLVFTENNQWIKVTNITFDETVVKVGNIFSISGKRTYFADGILVYEENPYLFPYMMMYRLYCLFAKSPILSKYKDIFLF